MSYILLVTFIIFGPGIRSPNIVTKEIRVSTMEICQEMKTYFKRISVDGIAIKAKCFEELRSK